MHRLYEITNCFQPFGEQAFNNIYYYDVDKRKPLTHRSTEGTGQLMYRGGAE